VGERRLERVGHLVQAELARLLQRSVKDPRLAAVTITAVRMTADLRHARVYFRTFSPAAEHAATQRGLERAAPFLRGEVGRALGMRAVPELHFEYDETLETARRLEELLSGEAAAPKRSEPEDGSK
jgi:ribosome-binding factor A